MAIQPIDLQAMYNQMHNVAQNVAHQQQGVKLSESMQRQNMIQQNMENAERVNQTSNDGAQTSLVKEDGGGNNSMAYKHKRNAEKKEEDLQEENASKNNIREPYIGRIIDITR